MHSQDTAFLRMKGHSPFFLSQSRSFCRSPCKIWKVCLVCGFTSQSTAMAMSRRSFHLTTLFHGSLNCCMYFCTLLYVHSIFAIILMGKRELIALLVFLVSCDGCVTFPRGAMCLSAFCDWYFLIILTYYFD